MRKIQNIKKLESEILILIDEALKKKVKEFAKQLNKKEEK